MRSLLKNKRGGLTDIFLFMIFAFVIIMISVIFVYIGNTTQNQLHLTMDDRGIMPDGQNTSDMIDDTFGGVTSAYGGLYWISIFLIVGMIISIFIGSYLVTTKPIFFVPYFFITIIAVIVAVGISNAYETIMEHETLQSTFAEFVGSNFIMLNLPMWVAIIGVVGAIIMFVRMGSRDEQIYGGNGIYG